MAKWVTFYWSMIQGVQNLVEHKDQETAREYFLKHCFKYFDGFKKPPDFDRNFELPYSYGFPHRRFYGMTRYKFHKMFLEGKD